MVFFPPRKKKKKNEMLLLPSSTTCSSAAISIPRIGHYKLRSFLPSFVGLYGLPARETSIEQKQQKKTHTASTAKSNGSPEPVDEELLRDVVLAVGVLEGEVELVVLVEELEAVFGLGARALLGAAGTVNVNLHKEKVYSDRSSLNSVYRACRVWELRSSRT